MKAHMHQVHTYACQHQEYIAIMSYVQSTHQGEAVQEQSTHDDDDDKSVHSDDVGSFTTYVANCVLIYNILPTVYSSTAA